MNAWLWLLLAIAAEVGGTSALKASEGFTRPVMGIWVFICYCASFWCLSKAITQIPLGVAYAVWSGLGMCALAIVGWIVYHQKPDLGAWVGMGLILLGVVVLQLFSKTQAT
ncbi:MAG: multidrug efflux SMR transporter [bacterium]|nr:multidrug efflux SMR transporter [bacterium]